MTTRLGPPLRGHAFGALAPDERLPRYQRLRDEWSAAIAARRWRPGEAIPAEPELAEAHRVSIGTVRKAVDALEAEGLLERIQGRGTFVRRPKFDTSLFRFFRFEGADGERLTPQGRLLGRRAARAPAAVASALRLPSGAPAIHLVRLRLLEGRPFLAESIWVPRSRFAPLLDLEPAEFADLLYPLYERHCGQVVASAEETLTAEAAGAREARLLRIKVGSPLIAIERLALSYERQPLEWRRSHGVAEDFRYRVEIR
jgi:GntR family transcriptional regulator